MGVLDSIFNNINNYEKYAFVREATGTLDDVKLRARVLYLHAVDSIFYTYLHV